MTTLAARTVGHTPIPWDVPNEDASYERGGRPEVVAGVNVDGCENLPKICKMPDLSNKSYANAAFIVLACNAHDGLVAALKRMLEVQEALMPGLKHIAVQDYSLLNDAPCEALAALAKAQA